MLEELTCVWLTKWLYDVGVLKPAALANPWCPTPKLTQGAATDDLRERTPLVWR